MSIFDTIRNKFMNIVKRSATPVKVYKEDLLKLIENNIKSHKSIVSVLDNDIKPKELLKWISEVKEKAKSSNVPYKNIYNDYFSKLNGKALNLERACPFDSLIHANNILANILTEITKNIDNLIENDEFTVYTVRMSQLALMGVIAQSNRLISFTAYFYHFLVMFHAGNAANLPKYRGAYLVDNLNEITTLVNALNDKKGITNFLKEISDLKKAQADIIPGADTTFEFTGQVQVSRFSVSILDYILGGLSHLNILDSLLEAWDDYRLEQYRRNKEIKEWLEQHVALLKLEMNELDSTSPEYIKLTSVINAYSEMIAEYDQAIIKFEAED